MTELEQKFEDAKKRVMDLKQKPSNEEMLELYSLNKQATIGDLNIDKPAMFDFVAAAKYNAWNGKKGISKEDAQQKYIDYAESLLKKKMDKLQKYIEKAKHSTFYLWLLNAVLLRTVPFNKPHGIKIIGIEKDELTMQANYIRPNQNHIKGIHACLLATLCEYVSGLSLLLHFSPKDYRIILKNIHMTYHYQAKAAVQVKFKIQKDVIDQEILEPLKTNDAVFKEFEVQVYDTANNHICTGLINWQIKAWKNVKLKA